MGQEKNPRSAAGAMFTARPGTPTRTATGPPVLRLVSYLPYAVLLHSPGASGIPILAFGDTFFPFPPSLVSVYVIGVCVTLSNVQNKFI